MARFEPPTPEISSSPIGKRVNLEPVWEVGQNVKVGFILGAEEKG